MKTLQFFLLSFLFVTFSLTGFAQVKTESFKVSGECGMCKKKIEKAAKDAGATYAVWNTESKALTVKYKKTSAGTAKIQQAVARVGYDTPAYKATAEAYENLHECCKYEREGAAGDASCCAAHQCADNKCMQEGKCKKDMSCCKDAGCSEKDCCKKA